MMRGVIAAIAVIAIGGLTYAAQPGGIQVEQQTKLLSIELPGNGIKRAQVEAALDGYIARYGFKPDGSGLGIWNVEHTYLGKYWTSMVAEFLPERTFIILWKRPTDPESHLDMIEGLKAVFYPLGFTPWVVREDG